MTGGTPCAALLDAASRRLAAARIDNPRREARLLLQLTTGEDPASLLAGHQLDDVQSEIFERLVDRRLRREPMAYLRGRAGFWDLDLEVGPGVLVPRPETETLIETTIEILPDAAAPLRILDLGTGSGCLALALLRRFPASRAVGVDAAAAAIACCRGNAQRLGLGSRLDLVHGDWSQAPAGPFDLIVSNPPYVSEPDHAGLQPEVRDHEPRLALVAGADGLDAYRALVPQAAPRLAPGGWLLLEIGAGQHGAVQDILAANGLVTGLLRRDLAGIERCIAAR